MRLWDFVKLNFAAAKKQSLEIWNDYLGRIVVEGKNDNDKIKNEIYDFK